MPDNLNEKEAAKLASIFNKCIALHEKSKKHKKNAASETRIVK